MTITELLLNTKNVKYEELIWQDEILTEEQRAELNENGYMITHTKKSFEEDYNISSDCVCYSKSISNPVLYFNRETLAASCFPMLMYENNALSKEDLYNALKNCEKDVEQGQFIGSLLSLPDSLRIVYFNLLVDNSLAVENLYDLFMSFYSMSDYGFHALSSSTIEAIICSKTEQDWAKTKKALSKSAETIKIYRGQTVGVSTPVEKALSWTTDIRIANFFATKNGSEQSEIIIAEVSKDKIIEYFTDRNEFEVLVRYDDLRVVDRIQLYGVSLLDKVFPEIKGDYAYYRSKLSAFKFPSEIHGILHTQRVLLHLLILCDLLKLSHNEKKILCTAAMYHDLGRVHDYEDLTHGVRSRKIYESNVEYPSPVVSFLIEYHSRPDEDGFKEIENNPRLSGDKELVILLYNVFKDADALDRVRLGLRDLDLNYLRLPESKRLTKIARLLLENIK